MSDRDFTVVPLPDDFDVLAAFRSEAELSEAAASPAPADSPTDAAPGPPARSEADGASLLVADLIENNVHLEWPEAVAITTRLCRAMARDPAANPQRASLEPWTIEITGGGNVHLLPGPPSGDPVVKQLGRMLRALLHDSNAPAELRLLASQACFEVPIFASVDDVLTALQHFDRPGESDAIRSAFRRGVEAKFSAAPSSVLTTPPIAPARSLMLEPHRALPPPPRVPRAPRRRAISARALIVCATVLTAASAWGITRMRSRNSAKENQSASVSLATTPPVSRQPASTPLAMHSLTPAPTVDRNELRAGQALMPLAPRAVHAPTTSRPALSSVSTVSSAAPPTRATAKPNVSSMDSSNPLQAAERRASALISAGRMDEAAIVFDSILFKNPSYHLDPARSEPQTIALFRRSKRVIVQGLAREHYDEAVAALNAGDVYRAIAEGDRAAGLIADRDLETSPSDLSGAVANVLIFARAAKEAQEKRVYSIADGDVVPPRPIGRQLPADPPAGRLNDLTGRLEILVDRSGRVESVKLHTPHNNYHDRMIVSAAKAWRYQPATRNGRPVRFNIVMSINLPQS